MSTVTYTATNRSGGTHTRTSGTMYYTHMSLARGSWHTSHAAAVKAGDAVPAVPTAVNGRAEVGDYARSPQAAAIDALIVAKNAAAPKPNPKRSNARAEAEARADAVANRAARRKLAERQAASEDAHAAEVARREAVRRAVAADPTNQPDPRGVLIGTFHTNQTDAAPASDGGPLGHLCECLSQHTGFSISHGAECPAAPSRQPAADALPLF